MTAPDSQPGLKEATKAVSNDAILTDLIPRDGRWHGVSVTFQEGQEPVVDVCAGAHEGSAEDQDADG